MPTERWVATADALPDEDVVVRTKVHDADGCRHERFLKRRGGLWFVPDGADGGLYVCYQPSHWTYR